MRPLPACAALLALLLGGWLPGAPAPLAAEPCGECHEKKEIGAGSRSVHPPFDEDDCTACHADHGDEGRLVLVAAGNALCEELPRQRRRGLPEGPPRRSRPEGRLHLLPRPAPLDRGAPAAPEPPPAAGLRPLRPLPPLRRQAAQTGSRAVPRLSRRRGIHAPDRPRARSGAASAWPATTRTPRASPRCSRRATPPAAGSAAKATSPSASAATTAGTSSPGRVRPPSFARATATCTRCTSTRPARAGAASRGRASPAATATRCTPPRSRDSCAANSTAAGSPA